MVSIRPLKKKDAQLMLEWMHDSEVQKGFKKKMMDMRIEQAEGFCEKARIPEKISQGDDLHFAIVNEEDEYLGTVSLKEIDLDNKNAEYAISLRRVAWGNGNAVKATKLLLNKAFNEYGLNRVFLTVLADNLRAQKMYEKCGFKKEGVLRSHIYKDGEYVDWCLYGILKSEFKNS